MSIRAVSLLLIDPSKAFAKLAGVSTKKSLILLAATIAASAILIAFYYQHVDITWLVGQMTQTLDATQRESAINAFTRSTLTISGVIGVALMVPLLNIGVALYLFLVTKVRGIDMPFSRWFAIVVWSSAPALLILPIGVVSIAFAGDDHMRPETMNPVSLNQLLFHVSTSSPWKALLDNISLITIWSVILCAVGVHAWTRMTARGAMLLSAFPYVLAYGTWAGIVMVSTT